MVKKILWALIPFLLFSCNTDDNGSPNCAAVLCAAGFNTINLKFLDSETDENLLDNETINTDAIEIRNEKNEEVTFTLEEIPNNGTLLIISVSVAEYGQKSFTITFDQESSFSIRFDTSFSEGGECCGPFTLTENVEIDTYPHELIEYGHLPLYLTVYTQ